MSTAFSAITAALVAALVQAPALANGQVSANRTRPIGQLHTSAVVVRLEGADSSEIVIGALDWTSRYAIECYGRGAAASDPAEAVDALLQRVWLRLLGVNPAALGVLSVNLNPAIDWQFDDSDAPYACAVLRLVVQHRTAVASLAPLN
jgi:hypothetical protein